MRFFLFLLLSLCSAATLIAQPVPTQNDPPITNDDYQEIYNRIQSRLTELGYPAGRAGNAAWARGQYTLRYEGASAASDFSADLTKLRNLYGAGNVSVLGECGCSDDFRIYNIHVTPLGGEEKGKGGSRKVAQAIGQEEVEPNYYIIPGLNQLEANTPFNNLPPNFAVVPSGKPALPVTVAVLDTGIDPYFQHPQTTKGHGPLYLWENNSPDDPNDPFCLDGDLFGWDFINNDNAPLDDHSHGTHVASGIASQLTSYAPDVNYRFMAVKMLDQAGVGTTFHASCAVAYAAYHKADVINASWGFYGERDAILQKAFAYAQARGVATVTSAGNFRKELSTTKHYPSEFALETNPLRSILFVSASQTGSGTNLWRRTNFRSAPLVPGMDFVAARGTNVTALVPSYFNIPNNVGRKTGTSVAAPLATALAAHYRHLHPGDGPVILRTNLLNEINAQGAAASVAYLGTMVPYRVFNWIVLP
ncbi:S8 family serine peptidase [Neolewinella aurantiaca]|uniref:S8 family serine peptidase n=1 Tax=Neolewinella aurantiaca TaxID=2602767 RepID=A0A5C7FGB0_9BACT|nr:S8 family serine peptidase [Neolewinella aurantiaca]TXF89987.1 S8 family serine peptidase [Neolewinella aurantiaca]